MNVEMVEQNRIRARGEDAAHYEVVEYQLVITHVIDSAVRRTKSGHVYRLVDGRDVHWVNTVTFQIVETGKLITRL